MQAYKKRARHIVFNEAFFVTAFRVGIPFVRECVFFLPVRQKNAHTWVEYTYPHTYVAIRVIIRSHPCATV